MTLNPTDVGSFPDYPDFPNPDYPNFPNPDYPNFPPPDNPDYPDFPPPPPPPDYYYYYDDYPPPDFPRGPLLPLPCANITTINDGFTELNESFEVVLSSFDQSVLIGTLEFSAAVVNITDDGDSKSYQSDE